jgi:hypothetical protein
MPKSGIDFFGIRDLLTHSILTAQSSTALITAPKNVVLVLLDNSAARVGQMSHVSVAILLEIVALDF